MANFTKHMGKTINDTKVAVVFMQMPEEPNMTLVVDVDSLEHDLQDDLMEVINSPEGQNTKDLSTLLHRRSYRQGGSLLEALHSRRKLMKKPVTEVFMTPNNSIRMPLSEIIEIWNQENSGDTRSKEQVEYDRNIKREQIMNREEQDKESIGRNLLMEANELREQSKLLSNESRRKEREAEKYLGKKQAKEEKENLKVDVNNTETKGEDGNQNSE